MKRTTATLAALAILGLSACGAGPSTTDASSASTTSTSTTSTITTPSIPSDVPVGFKATGGSPGVYYEWTHDTTDLKSCKTYDDSCWAARFFTEYGCSTLYVEISILDSTATTVLGRANEIVSGLRAGEQALIAFGDTNPDTSRKARLATVNCY